MLRHIVMYKLREDCDKAKAIEEIIQAYQQGTPLSDYFNHNYE